MTIEKVSQPEMLQQFQDKCAQFKQRLNNSLPKLENEVTALKLQGAIETLQYYNPEETAVTSSRRS